MSQSVTPFSLKDAPALIETLLPVQKLSAEAYKEQMAVQGKTLTALGSYWKGRKPLILAKACVLGCLLPATDNPVRDLDVFEKLMAMDLESFVARQPRRLTPREITASIQLSSISDFFDVEPKSLLPDAAPVDWSNPEYLKVLIKWREDVSEIDRRRLTAELFKDKPYRERVNESNRPEEVGEDVHLHIWSIVNDHLGTEAFSFPELVAQLGVMRFGHRPRIADTFCGSGQIPFEAARLGCDVYASDLSPVACMLTWGAFNIVGGLSQRQEGRRDQRNKVLSHVSDVIQELALESDGTEWSTKAFLYCVEVLCPQGWRVPLLPTRIISKGHKAIAELVPDPTKKRYEIVIKTEVTDAEMKDAKEGTVRTAGRGQDPYILHTVGGVDFRTKITTLRGDYRTSTGEYGNKLRMWEKSDVLPRDTDLFQERLYAIQWMRQKPSGVSYEYSFRGITPSDLQREQRVNSFITENLEDWQYRGWLPDMRIEPGDKTDEPIRTRGWRYWHHLFNPRQLLVAGLINRFSRAEMKLSLAQVLNSNSRLSRWSLGDGDGRSGGVKGTFDNQALNTLFNYGTRSSVFASELIKLRLKSYPLCPDLSLRVSSHSASEVAELSDIYITDPPYGDAVNAKRFLNSLSAGSEKPISRVRRVDMG